MVQIEFDSGKRDECLAERGLDFADAAEVFEGLTFDRTDNRRKYPEARIVTVGHLRGRMVIVVWTPVGEARRVISMRKANDRERARFSQQICAFAEQGAAEE